MKLQNFITSRKVVGGQWSVVGFLLLTAYCLLLTITAKAQRIALLTPEKTLLAEEVSAKFAEKLDVMDSSLVELAIKAQPIENFYNLSTVEAKNLGNSIGCDFFIIFKAENLRRSSLSKPVYFESYLVVYLISTRTGGLVFWTLKSFEGDTPNIANTQLFASLNNLANEISTHLKTAQEAEIKAVSPPQLEELPAENSPEAKNFTSPLPFKRYIPVYKRLANLYGITATIDATVDLDDQGKLTRIEITRWAGYNLDESVIETIKKMEWRPASRNGKTLPIRVLLRYNFKKVEKDR